MELILHIDTSTENALVTISQDGNILGCFTNDKQKDHASFLQPAIRDLLNEHNIALNSLNAVAVTEGPGSYTGLRVGMASAKGLCYALEIPLITISTLEVMALSVIEATEQPELYLYCPMIDARRMEVFAGIFDAHLNVMRSPQALVLEPTSFEDFIDKKIVFSGNGAKKFIDISLRQNLLFTQTKISAFALVNISIKKYLEQEFADLSTVEPAYLKNFYNI
jgi:tRNA threonylcarbamoyladenosine biosynthesis protein TsaB